jgi:hypothetical protein
VFSLNYNGKVNKMKRTSTSQIFIVFCLFFTILALLPSSSTMAGEDENIKTGDIASKGILDGKKFVGPTGEKGKKAHHEDTLSFDNGMFTSSACIPLGFNEGPYTTRVEGDTVYFQAKTMSPTHGKIMWQGTLKGNTLDVQYNWIKKRWLWTISIKYWFKGTLVR